MPSHGQRDNLAWGTVQPGRRDCKRHMVQAREVAEWGAISLGPAWLEAAEGRQGSF